MLTFEFYSDPSHGWLKVPTVLLHTLGIAESISAYSYQRGDYAYLEEDCDYSLFKAAYESQVGEFNVRERVARYRQSRIRNYNRFSALIVGGVNNG